MGAGARKYRCSSEFVVIRPTFAAIVIWACLLASLSAQRQRQFVSGIYPHLAMFNDENECGTGAVVPWADRLWVITYAPHKPRGSSDKLYEIDADLNQRIRPESIGGTPANRMIHRESQQLFIGPYVIDRARNVRVIPYAQMFGRPTANARHLTDPANRIYCATMEEGLYEIDVKTLAVTELWADEQRRVGRHSGLPGYHGKGLYSGQGRLVYANNGEHGARAMRDPTTASGVLAEWDGKADAWTVVQRSQFTEVTGPGGIQGNASPATDPIWSIGWDHRSLILRVLVAGNWHSYRLPKGSHSYDGAHGWNTEWPRIRDVGETDLLMTMHGLLWRFPRDFRPGNTSGLAARSAYLKVVGDFCRYGESIVFGCDDTARSEFLNKRKLKGEIAAPRSQSNLWFVAPEQLDRLGPVRAVGGMWGHEDVPAGAVSEPFLVGGFDRCGLHLAHAGSEPATVVVEVAGAGEWQRLREVSLAARAYQWLEVPAGQTWQWLRVRAPHALRGAVAFAHLANKDERGALPGKAFAGLATDPATAIGGLIRARGGNKTSLAFAAQEVRDGRVVEVGCYELELSATGERLTLEKAKEGGLHQHTLTHAAIPADAMRADAIWADAASLVVIDDNGRRWRLPKLPSRAGGNEGGRARVVREVATERDLLSAGGTFYELPAANAGGFRKLRPVASHDHLIQDFCSYRGLLVMSGLQPDANGPHVVRSSDGRAALWIGAIDDLWQLGKVRGYGGPWAETKVEPDVPSDPYIATGYDDKLLELSHDQEHPVTFTMTADVCGDGRWLEVRSFEVPARQTLRHRMPRAWSAYWVRFASNVACVASATFLYR